ncbi:helix-turn-helix domain-containing protein [Acrocarpospora macrocephala]|uniref:helix-turn-helix domain-containing protein n=1 Tax=Acrocarpospora macrocephala TaxID=150177 RepID=UPI001478829A|nr:XRE family transcriptional regulator [Acrocarpospora macrocephala]
MAKDQGLLEVGRRVSEARRARGLSQDHLADAMGLDRTAITKIEAGRRQIKSLELVRLAEILDRPLQWFVSAPPSAIVSRRAAIADPLGDQKSDQAIEDLARDVRLLVDIRALVPGGHVGAIKPGDQGWASETAAAQAREAMCLDAGEPIHDLAEHAEKVGLFSFSLSLGEADADGAYVEVESAGVALINGDLDPGRRRSTLAHELGHHLFGDAYSLDWGANTSETERAIDSFAISLLFPRVGVVKRWSELRQDHSLRQAAIIVSAEYRISWTAALKQLKSFGLLSKDDYKLLDSRSPTRADYLECNLRITEELQSPYIATGFSAAAIRAYRSHRLSAERVTELLRGQIEIDELPLRDEIPLEAMRGELR